MVVHLDKHLPLVAPSKHLSIAVLINQQTAYAMQKIDRFRIRWTILDQKGAVEQRRPSSHALYICLPPLRIIEFEEKEECKMLL